MKSAILQSLTPLLVLLAPEAVIGKGSGVGIYAVIDQVTFDQDGSAPNTIRISGVFMVPVPMSSGAYLDPQRGFLYFRLASGDEQTIRQEWKQLKAMAGTGRVVGFTFYWVPNPGDPGGNPHHALEVSVHNNGEVASPEDYPLPFPDGIVQSGEKDGHFYDRVVAEFEKAAKLIAVLTVGLGTLEINRLYAPPDRVAGYPCAAALLRVYAGRNGAPMVDR